MTDRESDSEKVERFFESLAVWVVEAPRGRPVPVLGLCLALTALGRLLGFQLGASLLPDSVVELYQPVSGTLPEFSESAFPLLVNQIREVGSAAYRYTRARGGS